jgi:2-oxoglutarate ferredoxin oxidoreductase subunit gamma
MQIALVKPRGLPERREHMQSNKPSRYELIIAGLGGMGVLVAGRLLASAAARVYKHISWVPSYATERRGGLVECTVVLSDQEIASPILSRAQTVMLLDASQLKAFQSRVRPGGLVIAESASLKDNPARTDFRLLPVSGLEIAMGMGGMVVNNMIMLGVYTELIKPLLPDLIEKELESRYARKEAILKSNTQAFRRGLELGKAISA